MQSIFPAPPCAPLRHGLGPRRGTAVSVFLSLIILELRAAGHRCSALQPRSIDPPSTLVCLSSPATAVALRQLFLLSYRTRVAALSFCIVLYLPLVQNLLSRNYSLLLCWGSCSFLRNCIGSSIFDWIICVMATMSRRPCMHLSSSRYL
jgi:hypothetical protein